jgi:hypothetical protein
MVTNPTIFKEKTSAGKLLADDPFSDFRKFLYVIWKHLNLPAPTAAQYDIANTLQKAAYGAEDADDLRRLVIEAFRGIGKSWVTAAFCCWLLYMNPQLKILVVSASKMKADEFTTFTLRLLREVKIITHLAPQRHQRQSSIAFDVGPAQADIAPSVKSLGISGQLAGSRADVIIPDDIEVQNNSATQGMRDKLLEAIKEFDAILKPNGRVIYLGTPQTEMSIYNELPNRGYVTRIWPARIPNEKQLLGYGNKIAPYVLRLIHSGRIVGTSMDVERFSDIDLAERALSYGLSGFALQFMLDTSLSDAEKFPLRLSDLIVMDTNVDKAPEDVIWSRALPNRLDMASVGFQGDHFYTYGNIVGDWLPYTGSAMTIDPSGRGEDETSYAVSKTLNSRIYITKFGGFAGGYSPECLAGLAQVAMTQKVNVIIVESNFGDGMFVQLFKPYLKAIGYQVKIEEIRHSTQKERRIIDTLEPVMNQHRLIFDRDAVENDWTSTQKLPPEKRLMYQLFYQMTRITKDRGAIPHDDRLEAVAMAVAYWVKQMSQVADDNMDERRMQALRDHVAETLKAASMGLAVFTGATPHQAGNMSLMGRRR